MSDPPRLLFLSPVMPAPGGNGLAMRAGLFLDALAADYRVDLLVVPVADPDCGDGVPAYVAARTERVEILGLAAALDPHFALIAALDDTEKRAAALAAYPRPFLCRHSTGRAVARAAALFGAPYAALHVLRLYMAPLAAPFLDLDPRPLAVLDLDEVESRSHRRLADLCRLNGDAAGAARLDAEAGKFAATEGAWLSRFDRVACSASNERAHLEGKVPATACVVVPNAVALLPAPAVEAGVDPGGRFLFVGSMGFAPNADAVQFYCDDVWPAVREALLGAARLTIVGSHPPAEVRRLAARPGVSVTGAVDDVAPYYGEADIAIVPLRAGGGTRIKILEAFAHDRPVIATSLGAEGLNVRHGVDIWLADGPADLAAACIRLAGDRGLRRRLAAGGRRTLATHYDADRVKAEILALYRPSD